MKERREEVHKDNQLPKRLSLNPYIFAGLEIEAQEKITGEQNIILEDLDQQRKLNRIIEATQRETGYSPTKLRQSKKGRIGLSTARQACVCLMIEEVVSPSVIGRFICRDHSNVIYIRDNVKDRIGMKGYELLTTMYNDIKSSYERN